MRSRWSDEEAARFVARYGARWGEELALRTYTSRLLGAEDRLVLHGGGNTSMKGTFTNRLGEAIPAMYVKASGHDLATLEPEGLPGLDLGYLRKLRALEALDDEAMAGELRTHLFDARSATPSLETLVHAFLPEKFVDHTHADAILALSHQIGGERLVREALAHDVAALGSGQPGVQLTPDQLTRTTAFPRWIGRPGYDEPARLAAKVREAVRRYGAEYHAYVERHASRLPRGLGRFDALPRVVLLPGLGALCAGGDVRAAGIARDITAHTLAVKAEVGAMGNYEGLPEAELFDMEYHSFQHAKLS